MIVGFLYLFLVIAHGYDAMICTQLKRGYIEFEIETFPNKFSIRNEGSVFVNAHHLAAYSELLKQANLLFERCGKM